MISEPDDSQKSFGQKAKEALGGLAANAQAAARLAAKQAERAKLANVTLPRAYRELGEAIHATGRYRDQFPDEFGKADELKGRIEALRQASPETDGASKSFTDRAKDAAGKARDAALAKKLDGDLNSAWRRLGQAAFAKLGADSGSPDLVGPIEECRQRLATLDAEIQAIDGAASGVLTPRRLLVGAGACIVVVLAFGAWAMFGGVGSEHRREAASRLARWEALVVEPDDELMRGVLNELRREVRAARYMRGPRGVRLEVRKEPYLREQAGIGTAERTGFLDSDGEFILHGQSIMLTSRGRLRAVESYLDGKQVGRAVYWIPGGPLLRTTMSVGGTLEGEEIIWYPTGRLHRRRFYKAGRLHGIAKCWDKEGRLQVTSTYVNGELDGVTTYCLTAKQGQPTYDLLFREGRLVRPSRSEFIAAIYMLNNLTNVSSPTGVFELRMKCETIFDVFGRPSNIRPTFDSHSRRWWDYECRDGVLSFRAVTALWGIVISSCCGNSGHKNCPVGLA